MGYPCLAGQHLPVDRQNLRRPAIRAPEASPERTGGQKGRVERMPNARVRWYARC
jgi:hypothetical protein